MTTRLNKYLASAGVASRRGADALIAEGSVTVNGQPVTTPGVQISPDDVVRCNGAVVAPAEQWRLWKYYKPIGQICTACDPQGRQTVFDALPSDMGRVMSVGRLDVSSEGLLLLTNSGEVSRYYELPSSAIARCYKIRVRGVLSDAALDEIRQGVTVAGTHYRPAIIELASQQRSNSWYVMTLNEGKNREIRRIMEHYGHPVSRLIRLSYGEYHLEDMQPGEIREVKDADRHLKQKLTDLTGNNA